MRPNRPLVNSIRSSSFPRPAGRIVWQAGLAFVLMAAWGAASARAVIVGGGGSRLSDCLGVFDAPANAPATRPRNVLCVDGAACDADGTVDGVCSISVAFCANSTQLPACSLQGVAEIVVDHANDDGIDPEFDPQLQALQARIDNAVILPSTTIDECSLSTTFRVPVNGPMGTRNRCNKGRKEIVVTTSSTVIQGKFYRDRDKLTLTCLPSDTAGGCDPQTFFDSTFDRIQRQIFDLSCATATCHDSQSVAGGLLLETGASHGNLVGAMPSNGAAAGAGWLRVDVVAPGVGSLDTSFLYHKIMGDLPDESYGVRMPRGEPRLDQNLREVLRIWIENGAPDDSGGWLPGTF